MYWAPRELTRKYIEQCLSRRASKIVRSGLVSIVAKHFKCKGQVQTQEYDQSILILIHPLVILAERAQLAYDRFRFEGFMNI